MIDNLKTFGRFLDQPILISKLNKNMPKIMATGASLFLLHQAHDEFLKTDDKKEAKKTILKKSIILFSAITSALIAPKIAGAVTNRYPIDTVEKIRTKNKILVDEFIKSHKPDIPTFLLLDKAKNDILSLSDVKKLIKKLSNSSYGSEFINKLIPEPENIKASDIFKEIGYLSIYGSIPVVGGIVGGIGADIAVNEKELKKHIPDKINEGIYQYLANIFMCNIGAGAALALLEKMGITSKASRAIGMTIGIILTGVVGGSKIANLIASKINNIITPGKKAKERTPELMDLGLHTDDIATVSLLSGLKWIEPSLPILYSVSGYKSGIGYRN